MQLLILTQKIDINDDNLGFFVRWVEEFAKNVEEVFVIANFTGERHLPDKVKIFSLGKEKGFGRIRRYFNFFRYLFEILPKSDAVFVHMIPVWVVAGWPLYKIFRKKVYPVTFLKPRGLAAGVSQQYFNIFAWFNALLKCNGIYLWYTHKSVTFSLRMAEKIVEKIFTASRESFRLPSKKAEILGHGIDIEKFKPAVNYQSSASYQIITAGRIAPSKNLDILIETAEILKKQKMNFEMKIAGAPITAADDQYFKKLKDLIVKNNLKDTIRFSGAIPYGEIEKFYQKGDLFVNLSATGSLDKSVLEAMACGVNVLVSNEAFSNILPEENFIKNSTVGQITERIKYFMDNRDSANKTILREIIVKNHNLKNLIKKLVENIN
ncbi:MAG: glycosyltransferase family 4 protein [Candidatus Niyogibacteria bacterium]|nr:glycosyltransferase family 4 protein [Candidatus Niyogibacteria bacterium]